MSADTITTALFLITAVIAAGVLINAIYPVVYNMAGTFSSATHESDQRMRTDFKIILITANGEVTPIGDVPAKAGTAWLKNIGSVRIPMEDIQRSDVFCGAVGDFTRLNYGDEWTATEQPQPGNGFWDPGETLEINFVASKLPTKSDGKNAYFQLVLPNGIWRSTEFAVN
jgi:archaeal flagellar protein FlaG